VSSLDSFKTFITQATRYKTLNIGQQNAKAIVIKGLPSVFGYEMKSRRDQILKSLESVKTVPIIIIHTLYDAPTINSSLYREFPKDFLNSTNLSRIDLKGFTERQIQDKIVSILQAERVKNKSIQWNSKDLKLIAEQANGDMSNAICLIEMFSKGETKKYDKKDEILDIHHAAGRILYAKNEPGDKNVNENVHVTDDILISYVHHNLTDFCTDIDEIARIEADLSTSDLFFSRWLPLGEHMEMALAQYGFTIAMNSYLTNNKHKVGNKFRTIRAPLIKQVTWDCKTNRREGSRLFPDQSKLFSDLIPFYKRLKEPYFTSDQVKFMAGIHNYTFRNGQKSFYVTRDGDHEKECNDLIVPGENPPDLDEIIE
jgi:hypothetical protein